MNLDLVLYSLRPSISFLLIKMHWQNRHEILIYGSTNGICLAGLLLS